MNRRYFTKKRVLFFIVAIFIAYVSSYCILSINGSYYLTQSGQIRYNTGLSVTDIEQWQPKYARCQLFRDINGRLVLRGNALGYFYSPLILLDQKLIHPTKRILSPSEKI